MARLTIDFPDALSEDLTSLAKANQTTKREIIRRSLSLYKYLHDQGVRGVNTKLSITDKNDRILKDIVF